MSVSIPFLNEDDGRCIRMLGGFVEREYGRDASHLCSGWYQQRPVRWSWLFILETRKCQRERDLDRYCLFWNSIGNVKCSFSMWSSVEFELYWYADRLQGPISISVAFYGEADRIPLVQGWSKIHKLWCFWCALQIDFLPTLVSFVEALNWASAAHFLITFKPTSSK